MANNGNLTGKVILVTGATSGIGEVTSLRLAGMGATVVLCGRDPQKTDNSVKSIRSQTGNDQVHGLVADLSSQSQVRKLAEDFRARYDRLDVLVNNAGAIFMRHEETVDGIEMTFALNHLNYFLLTNLLLDMLQASSPARIVNVSSEAHRSAKLNFSDLENKTGYSGWKAYGQSKLANLYFTYHLSAALENSGVTVNALHPGFVASNFGKNNVVGILSFLFKLIQLGAIKPEEGAQTSIYLASSPEVEDVTGKYFVKQKSVKSSQVSYDTSAARQLWDISLEMTGLPVIA